MTAAEARDLAEELIGKEDLRGHRYVFAEAKRLERYPGRWTLVFKVFSPQNTLIDGPVIMYVDENEGTARFLEAM